MEFTYTHSSDTWHVKQGISHILVCSIIFVWYGLSLVLILHVKNWLIDWLVDWVSERSLAALWSSWTEVAVWQELSGAAVAVGSSRRVLGTLLSALSAYWLFKTREGFKICLCSLKPLVALHSMVSSSSVPSSLIRKPQSSRWLWYSHFCPPSACPPSVYRHPFQAKEPVRFKNVCKGN